MRTLADLPSGSFYYHEYNSGWTGDKDLLTQVLNSRGIEISHGDLLGYQWVSGGWKRWDGGDQGHSPIDRYTGFLKCLYMTGTVGANAGYYGDPPRDEKNEPFAAKFATGDPPHWLLQLTALGHVHALFSHVESFLRDGALLPGPNKHRWTKANPAYEFPNSATDANVRVLARKLRKKPEWLIVAWAADGPEREVQVEIPELGRLTLLARPAGSVYRARLDAQQKPIHKLLDVNGLTPTVGAQANAFSF
jgi:hypothetical protein